MKKGAKIAIAVGSVVLGLGAFVLYRKNKINRVIVREARRDQRAVRRVSESIVSS